MKEQFSDATATPQPLPSWKIDGNKIFVGDKLVGQPPAVTIYFYAQTSPPPGPPRALPPDIQLRHVHFTAQEDKSPCPAGITEDQFAALYNSVAKASAWWPMTRDAGWDWKGLFDKTDLYVMYQKDKPIGFFSLDHQLEDPNAVKLLYIGVLPSMQGKKLGGHLLDQAISKAWTREDFNDGLKTRRVVLDTAPGYDRMLAYKKPVATLYEAKAFNLDHIQVSKPGDPGTALNQFNFPKYWENIDSAGLESALNQKFHVAAPEPKPAFTPVPAAAMAVKA